MSKYFNGNMNMEESHEQKYLGDILSPDGTHTKNVQDRRNKGYGILKQIMQILDSTYFGKFYFEVAMILRDSLFISSILLNSEAWVNYKENDIRILEQCDELLLSRILDCDGKTSNTLKYLELGAIPIRFLIMKRKLLFLQYILKQDKKSMMYNILKAIQDEPRKNDFVTTCKKYIETLKMNLSFKEIEKMSKFQLRKILLEMIKNEALAKKSAVKTRKDQKYSIQ